MMMWSDLRCSFIFQSYTYKPNDLVATVISPRIVSGTTKYKTTYNYNTRNLLTSIAYNDSGATPGESLLVRCVGEYHQYRRRRVGVVHAADECERSTGDEPDEQFQLSRGRERELHVGCGGEYDGRRSDQFSVRCGESVKDGEQRDDGDERV
jgi:hypothetical protein